MKKIYQYALILFLMPAIILAIYYPGLAAGFVFDDFSNIVLSSGIKMQEFSWDSLKNAALSMDGRPIARASFGLNHLVTGLDPFYFKAVNLAIHIVNFILLFFLMQLLICHYIKTGNIQHTDYSTFLIAAAIALAWALHPVNLTNVLYSVQRMNSMSAMFVLAGMISYTRGRTGLDDRPLKSWLLIISSVAVFLPLAWFSKENGALLPLFLFLIELALFRFLVKNNIQKKGLYLFFTIFLLIPAALLFIYMIQRYGLFQNGYGNRNFSLTERLLTEPRVIWLYIRMILLPTQSVYGLFHDDIVVSTSLFDPKTTIFAIAGLMALLVLAIASIKRAPILAFGLLFFFAGHLMESTVIPLELAFEHRNYLPSIGLLMPVFYYLRCGGNVNRYTKSRVALITVIILLLGLYTHFRAWQWSDEIRLYLIEVQHHPKSARANYEAGKIFAQRQERLQGDPKVNYHEAIKYFEQVTALRDNSASGLFGSILISIDSGKRIDPRWIDELAHRLETKPLEQVSLHWLDKTTDCVIRGKCGKNDIQIPRLVKAALSYEKVSNRSKLFLYNVLAKYYYRVEKDYKKAVAYGQKARSAMPSDLYSQVNLVKYLILSGDKIKARKALDSLSRQDINRQHTAEIAKLKKYVK